MTQSPHPFQNMPYPAPPTAGPTARYAGILLLVLGVAALLMGGCVAAAGFAPGMETADELSQFRADLDGAGVSLKTAFIIIASMILVYALPAIIMGAILTLSRSKAASIVALVMVGLASLVMLLAIIAGLAQGRVPEAMFWVIAAGLHGLVLMWLIQSLRGGVSHSPLPMPGPYMPPQSPQPMQGYQYQPPKQDQPPRNGTGV